MGVKPKLHVLLHYQRFRHEITFIRWGSVAVGNIWCELCQLSLVAKFNIWSLSCSAPTSSHQSSCESLFLSLSLWERLADMSNKKICKCILFSSRFITWNDHLSHSYLSLMLCMMVPKIHVLKAGILCICHCRYLNYRFIYASNWAISSHNTSKMVNGLAFL